MDNVNKYIDKLFWLIDAYDSKLNTIINIWKNIYFKVASMLQMVFNNFIDFVELFAKALRYSTYPIHWIIIAIDISRMKPDEEKLRIFEVGAHYIYGKPGSGKSTMTYHAMMHYAHITGKVALTTAQMELPRRALNGASYYLHQRFKPSDIFRDGEQIVQINKERFNFIVYEEMLTQYNQRNNKESKYNDEVIPMIGQLGTQRHQGIDLFYFISQLPRADIQIMLMLNGYHIPKIKKAFDYKNWLTTGKYRFYIKGWKMLSYNITPKGNMDYELTDKKKWFYPNTGREDMKFFNRLNMASEFEKKPLLVLGGKI